MVREGNGVERGGFLTTGSFHASDEAAFSQALSHVVLPRVPQKEVRRFHNACHSLFRSMAGKRSAGMGSVPRPEA